MVPDITPRGTLKLDRKVMVGLSIALCAQQSRRMNDYPRVTRMTRIKTRPLRAIREIRVIGGHHPPVE
jgi:hypothetical protein